MSQQVWSTYAVNDHLHPRALATDIMLFDRLVFPVPQVADLRYQEADPTQPGPVVWSRNSVEWDRWNAQDWKPDDQESLLKLIEPVVRKVPWDDPHQQAWRKEIAQTAENNLPGYAFVATRTVLTRDLPAYITGVEAMGPAYRSVAQLEQELGLGKVGNQNKLPASALSAVLGWEFIVPDDDRMSNEELLRETVAFVTGDEKFRLHRANFWNWQRTYLKNGVTDRESIDAAVSDMHQLLEEQKSAASKMPMKNTVRYGFRVAPTTLAFAGLFFGPAAAAAGVAAGAFLSFAEIAAEKWFLKKPEENAPSPAAFVYDAQKRFGWK
jgi:hypothetical protein